MRLRKILITISSLLGLGAAPAAFAADPTLCPLFTDSVGYFKITRISTPITGCSVRAMADTPNIKGPTRSFQFFESGQMMSFIQIDDPTRRNSRTTGSHLFYILPTQGIPNVETFGLGATITDAAGLKWTVSETGDIRSESGCELEVLPNVSWENQGGFRIKKCPQRIAIDVGFKRGGFPLEDLTRVLRIIDPSGLSCSIQNHQLFARDSKGEFKMKHEDGPQLYAALKQIPSCAKLDLRSLLNSNSNSSETPSETTIRAEPNKHSGAR
ncbi:MAG: hypothetical protein ACK5P6_02670 [Pseudobdellovibrionaceae bacterium]